MVACLKTQLKENVNNDSRDYLEKVILTITFGTGFGSELQSVGAIRDVNNQAIPNFVVENLNNDGSEVVYNSGYLQIKKGTENTISILVPKYEVYRFVLYALPIYFDLSDIVKFYNIEYFDGGGEINAGVRDVASFRTLDTFILSNYAGDWTDIAEFANTQLETLELNYCSSIQGDLSSIKNMPNLQTLTLNHTPITDTENTVAYLRSKGVTVTYVYGI